jgi:hypothetical protein
VHDVSSHGQNRKHKFKAQMHSSEDVAPPKFELVAGANGESVGSSSSSN